MAEDTRKVQLTETVMQDLAAISPKPRSEVVAAIQSLVSADFGPNTVPLTAMQISGEKQQGQIFRYDSRGIRFTFFIDASQEQITIIGIDQGNGTKSKDESLQDIMKKALGESWWSELAQNSAKSSKSN